MLQKDEIDNPRLDNSLQNIRDMQLKLLNLKLSDPLRGVNFRSGELKLLQSQANPCQNQPNTNPISDEYAKSLIPIANFNGSQSAVFSQGEKINSMNLSQVMRHKGQSSRNMIQQPNPEQNQIEFLQEENKIHNLNGDEQKILQEEQNIFDMYSSQVIHPIAPSTRNKIQHPNHGQNQKEFKQDEMQEEDKIQQLNDNLEQKIHDQHQKKPEIQLVSLYKQVELKKNNCQKLLAMISIKAEDAKQTKEIPQVGVDLICLIDRSGSMKGQKMNTVKQCLTLLLEFLSEKDRLCLIVFDSLSQKLCSFKLCSLQNKIKIRQIIQKIYANGCTDIGSSTKLALQQIKERKFKNKVTSIFLLSDGQDSSAYASVKNQLEQIDDPFTIHSFGFGSDHDAKMMSDICSLRNGAFYLVNEISLLDEYFVNALGSLVGVFYDKINIRIEVMPNDVIQNLSICKTYGHMWKPLENNQIYNINLQQIAQGQRRDYLFKIKFPQLAKISDAQRQQTIIKAIVKMRNIDSNQIIEQQVNLQLQFYNENEKHHMLEYKDNEVEIQYYRVKAANVISKANQLCQEGQYQEGLQILNKFIDKIKINHVADKLKEILEDLQQAVKATQPDFYLSLGSKQMSQMCSNNLNQAGQNSRFDINLMQQSQPMRGMFDSQTQDFMRVNFIARKSQI